MSWERKKQSRLKRLGVKRAKWRRQSAALTKGASNCHRELLYTHIADVFTQKGIISYLNSLIQQLSIFCKHIFTALLIFFPRASVLAAVPLALRAQRTLIWGGNWFVRGGRPGENNGTWGKMFYLFWKAEEGNMGNTLTGILGNSQKKDDAFPLQSFRAHFQSSFILHLTSLLHCLRTPPTHTSQPLHLIYWLPE